MSYRYPMDERWAYEHITLTDGMVMAWDETGADWIYCGGSVVEAVAALIAYGMYLDGHTPKYKRSRLERTYQSAAEELFWDAP